MSKPPFISTYDEVNGATSRTRLEDGDGKVICSLGCYNGQIWYHDESSKDAVLLKKVWDDEIDQAISTAILVAYQDRVFAAVGFLNKGGKSDSFHLWQVKPEIVAVPLGEELEGLKRFGAAFIVEPRSRPPAESSSSAHTVEMLLAFGLMRKDIHLWRIVIHLTEGNLPTSELLGKITCRKDVSSLGFDLEGRLLLALSGDNESLELNSFELPSSWQADKKYKFENKPCRKDDLQKLANSASLGASLKARDDAMRHPKDKNKEVYKWNYLFPFRVVEQPKMTTGDDNEETFSLSSSTSASASEPKLTRKIRNKRHRPVSALIPNSQEDGTGEQDEEDAETEDPTKYSKQNLFFLIETLSENVSKCLQAQTEMRNKLEIVRQEQKRLVNLLERTSTPLVAKPNLSIHTSESTVASTPLRSFFDSDACFSASSASRPALQDAFWMDDIDPIDGSVTSLSGVQAVACSTSRL